MQDGGSYLEGQSEYGSSPPENQLSKEVTVLRGLQEFFQNTDLPHRPELARRVCDELIAQLLLMNKDQRLLLSRIHSAILAEHSSSGTPEISLVDQEGFLDACAEIGSLSEQQQREIAAQAAADLADIWNILYFANKHSSNFFNGSVLELSEMHEITESLLEELGR